MVRWKRSQDNSMATATQAASVNVVGVKEEGDWDVMFERLKTFKSAKGHCHADRESEEQQALGQWVMMQRREYIVFAASGKDGKAATCLTNERVQKLKSLGLDLTVSVVQQGMDSTGKRKKKAPSATEGDEPQLETRRPPKKRKNSLDVVAQKELQPRRVTAEPEQRDAAAHSDSEETRGGASVSRGGGERDDASPLVEKPVKGGDTAWETLMNVTALMPPLPTAAGADSQPTAAAFVAASPGGSVGGSSPSGSVVGDSPKTESKRVKSKYGDLDALPNAGDSYSSKYRAANNDVVPNQQRWEDMFSRLERFKAKHGHCRVPNRYPEDPSLGSWVATQRRYFKNKNLPMPEDRVRRLTDLGFEWTTKDPRKVPWETRFEGLKHFKERYGHVDVPHEWEECPQLGFWTANMRQQYRYKQLGKKSSLTDDRIELLNSIGFVWKMQGGRRRKSDPVARPNQSGSEAAPVVSPPTSAQKRMSFVVDAMSTGGMPRHSMRSLPYQPQPKHAQI